tara:strand:- start:7258 stop:7665 length:408 start_codon:yes stop_codon:yes gene_type:complete
MSVEKESGVRVKGEHPSILLMGPEEIDREETSRKIALYFKHGKNGKRSLLNFYISKAIVSDGPMCLQEMLEKVPSRYFTRNQISSLLAKSAFFQKMGDLKLSRFGGNGGGGEYIVPKWWFSEHFFNEIGDIDAES